MSAHYCHAFGCQRRVPPKLFVCRPHWLELPQPFRDAIWTEYRHGQENDKRPSIRYLAVQRAACAQLAFKPLDGKAALQTAQFTVESLAYRIASINRGEGDSCLTLPDPFNKPPMHVDGTDPIVILRELVRRINAGIGRS
jgi:hypothetical protein